MPIVTAGLAVGSAALGYGLLADGNLSSRDVATLGICLLVWMLIWLFNHRGRRAERVIFELGRQNGYDDGYRDGRRVAKPTVVPLGTRCCGECRREPSRRVAEPRGGCAADSRNKDRAARPRAERALELPGWAPGGGE